MNFEANNIRALGRGITIEFILMLIGLTQHTTRYRDRPGQS